MKYLKFLFTTLLIIALGTWVFAQGITVEKFEESNVFAPAGSALSWAGCEHLEVVEDVVIHVSGIRMYKDDVFFRGVIEREVIEGALLYQGEIHRFSTHVSPFVHLRPNSSPNNGASVWIDVVTIQGITNLEFLVQIRVCIQKDGEIIAETFVREVRCEE